MPLNWAGPRWLATWYIQGPFSWQVEHIGGGQHAKVGAVMRGGAPRHVVGGQDTSDAGQDTSDAGQDTSDAGQDTWWGPEPHWRGAM